MTPDPPFTLTETEKRSALWQRLDAHFRTRLELLRAKNDGPMTPEETATIRGQIKCLKGMIDLGKDAPAPTIS